MICGLITPPFKMGKTDIATNIILHCKNPHLRDNTEQGRTVRVDGSYINNDDMRFYTSY